MNGRGGNKHLVYNRDQAVTEKYSCHISTQIVEAIKPSLYSLLKVSPQGTQDGGRVCSPSDSQPLQPLYILTMYPEDTQKKQRRILTPDS